MMKKLCSALVLVMLFLCIAVQAEPTEADLADLKNYGIMCGDPDGNLRLSDTITRAEAAKMLCVLGNLEQVETDVFPDVQASHWAYGYIGAASRAGIIVGDENGNFNPEANITNEELVKMLVCLLGYEPLAMGRGGYPAGYTAAAAQFGLTKDMQFAIQTPAVRQDAAELFANALDIPIMEEKTEADGSQLYVILDGNGAEHKTLRMQFQ